MHIRVNGVVDDSIVDGPGLRFVIFTQGCYHNCKGCHNPLTHDIAGGYDLSFDEILETLKENPLNMGVTFSGGEPMLQAEKLSLLADEIKKLDKHIMIYSGFTLEEILNDPIKKNLLLKCDILVDGKFEIEKKDLLLKFRGSSNQNLIEIKDLNLI